MLGDDRLFLKPLAVNLTGSARTQDTHCGAHSVVTLLLCGAQNQVFLAVEEPLSRFRLARHHQLRREVACGGVLAFVSEGLIVHRT